MIPFTMHAPVSVMNIHAIPVPTLSSISNCEFLMKQLYAFLHAVKFIIEQLYATVALMNLHDIF